MPAAPPSVLEVFADSKSSDLCLLLLQDLPSRDRTLLILRHGLGLSVEEIARVVDGEASGIATEIERIERRVARLAATMPRTREPALCDS
ncbi:MAG: hypothetical protein MK082_04015 [Phycisphaerales bacterium]|nr:hypothetical protein [Phycisphaerales bacterium]